MSFIYFIYSCAWHIHTRYLISMCWMNKGVNESNSQTFGRLCDSLNILILKGKGNYHTHLEVCNLFKSVLSYWNFLDDEMFYIVLFNCIESISHIQFPRAWNVTSVPEKLNFYFIYLMLSNLNLNSHMGCHSEQYSFEWISTCLVQIKYFVPFKN